jgi:hypothetical protein
LPPVGIRLRVFTRLRITDSIRCILRHHLAMSNSKNRGFVANAGAFLSNATAMLSANESRGDDRLDEALKLANENESVIDAKDREVIQERIT